MLPGQRWLSEAEPDLGLGMVIEADARRVWVLFPATGEERVYARESAPLARVRLSEGETLVTSEGKRLGIMAVSERGGLLVYRCEDEAGQVLEVPEQQVDARMRLNRPQDRLLSGRLDADTWFDLRRRTWERMEAAWRSPVFGLVGPRVAPIPHQLYIAHEVAGRPAPRVLLADEVGLGKTIEAGLILHRLLLGGRAQRVLVVVPEALLHQWLVEMLRRFNLRFALFDGERFAAGDSANPFLDEQRVLCSLEFLVSAPEVARAALGGEWDLLVVDEAHHLHWSPEESSLEYELIEALAGHTPGVLLLTATPEQLGRAGHFARLRLLDPQRFHDYHAFLEEERRYAPVARLAARLLDGEALDEADRALLAETLGEVDDLEPEVLVRRLLDRHGTGRVLFRNTRQAIRGFPARQPRGYPLPLPADYRKVAHEPAPEVHFPRKWPRIDPRVDWLVALLRELKPEKVLVICAQADTVVRLRDWLFETEGLHVAVFHEGMEIVERDRAAAWFADPEEGCQALVCSEIGSEGRNFQFAHHLVLFDLPLEAELLEQRIGRLDRIGQAETIRIHVPYMEGSAGEVLYRWYHQGLGALEATCPAAGAVQEALAAPLREALREPSRTDALVREAQVLVERLSRELEAGRDRLLELHSHRPEVSAALVEAVRAQDGDPDLPAWLHDFWDAWGVEHIPGRGQSEVVRPGAHMRQEHFPGLPSSGMTVTYARDDALAHEDRAFLTWEHPMVRGAMEMLTSSELGSAALLLCRHPDYRTGTVFLELLYVIECLAPRDLEADRYLPLGPLRLLLDAQGEDRAAELPPEQLRGQDLAPNRKLVETVLRSQGKRLRTLFQLGEELAGRRSRERVGEALSRMRRELDAELERLSALAEVNANVREDELEQLRARRERLATHLGDARLRLDAARLVVMG